jgi:hypothetical protein
MGAIRVHIDGANMEKNGAWFSTWIVTNSEAQPVVCLGDFSGVHVETLIARPRTFNTLPNSPKGIKVTGYCKGNVPTNCGVAINLIQDGMDGAIVVKPND